MTSLINPFEKPKPPVTVASGTWARNAPRELPCNFGSNPLMRGIEVRIVQSHACLVCLDALDAMDAIWSISYGTPVPICRTHADGLDQLIKELNEKQEE